LEVFSGRLALKGMSLSLLITSSNFNLILLAGKKISSRVVGGALSYLSFHIQGKHL
jgi:hypothetical protein